MRKLLALVRKHLGMEYLDLADWLRSENSLPEIEQRIARGDYAGAVRKVEDAALKLAAEIHQSYVTSGQRAAKWLDELPALEGKLVRFDATASPVVLAAKRNELELVRGFTQERWEIARQITRRAMIEGAAGGINPRRVAQDFRDSIGLTPAQEEHVANYRRALESGDYGNALGRELRDARSDRTLRAARRDGDSLTPAQIDRLVDRYRSNYVTYRAETIARTEALRNANAGVDEMMRQAIDRGEVRAEDLIKTWHAGPATAHSRDQHQAMDGVSVGVNEPFVLPDGTRMMRPGDGPVDHVANCRCTVSTAFNLEKRRAA